MVTNAIPALVKNGPSRTFHVTPYDPARVLLSDLPGSSTPSRIFRVEAR